ncbi:MAG: 50S ribosomal protein L2, partial [Chloroflexota bacterium]
MPVKVYKPTSAGRRGMTGHSFEEITKSTPERSLTQALHKHGGRNSTGRVTVRHRGGGHKRRYRIIDFKRNKFDMTAEVIAIEYDPNRTSRIALLQYEDGERRYIVAPLGLKVGDRVASGEKAQLRIGDALQIRDIPVGTLIHNIELL